MEEGQSDLFPSTQKILYPISKIYGFIIKTRIFFYRNGILKSVRLPVPVISIGNITTGGTGKTPIVEYIANYLNNKGKKIAILSRGYAANIIQNSDSLTENACNDEYLLLKENIPDVPNLLNKNRIKSGFDAIKHFNAEYLILDDGFQHIKLTRDLDIVVIDALNPFGNEYMLPCGILREPLEELKRADMFILTHTDQCNKNKISFIINRLQEFSNNTPIVETVHKPVCLESITDDTTIGINYLNNKKVFAFCAIGNPLSFKKSIESSGAMLLGFHASPDHHIYSDAELNELNKKAQNIKPDAIIITQKDKVKIKNTSVTWNLPVWSLKIRINIVKGAEIFENKINKLLN